MFVEELNRSVQLLLTYTLFVCGNYRILQPHNTTPNRDRGKELYVMFTDTLEDQRITSKKNT
jgi:hypothetical protein